MLREAIWAKDGSIPTINEYMENGYVSFALGPIVLPTLYFLGVKLSEEVVQSSEYHKLYEVMSTQGRLMNDIHSFKVLLLTLLLLLLLILILTLTLVMSCVNAEGKEGGEIECCGIVHE